MLPKFFHNCFLRIFIYMAKNSFLFDPETLSKKTQSHHSFRVHFLWPHWTLIKQLFGANLNYLQQFYKSGVFDAFNWRLVILGSFGWDVGRWKVLRIRLKMRNVRIGVRIRMIEYRYWYFLASLIRCPGVATFKLKRLHLLWSRVDSGSWQRCTTGLSDRQPNLWSTMHRQHVLTYKSWKFHETWNTVSKFH